MRPSNYNIVTEDPDRSELIIFNCLYGSTASVKADWKVEASAILSGRVGSDSAMTREFARLGFLVEDDVDELGLLIARKNAGIKDGNRLEVIVMPNMDCNFACPYCYETHDHRNRMDPVVKGSLMKWLGNMIPRHKVILLQWFGGEPLLSLNEICEVTRHVRSVCDTKGVVLRCNITTNGYLLSKNAIKRLLETGIYSYQITVDGPPEVHDRTRLLRSGRGTFERIFSNIQLLARADSRVRISVRVNYNHQNIYSISELLELFAVDIRPQLRVVFEPIFGSPELSATSNIDPKEIARVIGECYRKADGLGYSVQHGGLGVGRLVYCYAEREHQFIVNLRGDVFKCSVGDFKSESRIGRIDESGCFVRDDGNWNRWFGLDVFEKKCVDCTFLPLCMGGCRKERLRSGGTGSYCNLVPTNTSVVLKSIAFGTFNEILRNESRILRACANGRRSTFDCGASELKQKETNYGQ
jgi:uncharacterized protein